MKEMERNHNHLGVARNHATTALSRICHYYGTIIALFSHLHALDVKLYPAYCSVTFLFASEI